MVGPAPLLSYNVAEDRHHGVQGDEAMSEHVYNLEWANGVLTAFENVYPQGCEEVREVLGLSRFDVLNLVRSDQVRWRQYKKFVKLNERIKLTYSKVQSLLKQGELFSEQTLSNLEKKVKKE